MYDCSQGMRRAHRDRAAQLLPQPELLRHDFRLLLKAHLACLTATMEPALH